MSKRNNLRHDLERVLALNVAEHGSATPTHILAQYLCDCLKAFDKATLERERQSLAKFPEERER